MGKSARILKSEARATESGPASPTATEGSSNGSTTPRVIQVGPGDVAHHYDTRTDTDTPRTWPTLGTRPATTPTWAGRVGLVHPAALEGTSPHGRHRRLHRQPALRDLPRPPHADQFLDLATWGAAIGGSLVLLIGCRLLFGNSRD
ncbi:hypothetical protein ACFC0C_22420 [Streptomyces sp. NPDC056178]|uniref:hypothetical protein n=1 Tax=Streptomyces sp. NPDC056178 TaxID=3345735 RepID=UPI0035DC3600